MIYAYRPRRKGRAALLLVGASFFVFLVAITYSVIFGEARYVLEPIALVSLAVAVLILGRYLLKDYIYSIEDGKVGPDLVVVEWQAKRRRTVARVALTDVTEVARETADTRRAIRRRMREGRSYDYVIDLGARDALVVFLTEDERKVAIRLSYDRRLEELLREAAARNGNKYRSEEETRA